MKRPILLLTLLIFIVLSICVSGLSSEGLVAYYNFTVDYNDSTDLGIYDGVNNNSKVYLADGKIGNSAWFNTIEQSFINVTYNSAFDLENFSLSFWFFLNDSVATNQGVLGKFNNEKSSYSYGIRIGFNRQLKFIWHNGTAARDCTLFSGDFPTLKTWTHIATTYDNSSKNISIFKNGNLVRNCTVDNIAYDLGDFLIGKDTSFFNGSVDEVGIFNVTLSKNNISDLYRNGVGWRLNSGVFGAETYYIGNDGSDSDDGLTENTAWKTISFLNGIGLKDNDFVRYNRSNFWRLQDDAYLSTKNGVTYTNYGIGDKPIFLGSINASNSANWTNNGAGNIWNSTFTSSINVGNIIFINGTTITTASNWTLDYSTLDKQDEMYYDIADDIVSIYSTENPSTVHEQIEVAIKKNVFSFSDNSSLVFDGLHAKYSSAHGFDGSRIINITIQNSDVSYIGGSINAGARFGNGIQFGLNISGAFAYNNNITQTFDEGITFQSWTPNPPTFQKNIRIINNTITFSGYGVGYFNNNVSSNVTDVLIDHNTIAFTGWGWYMPSGTHKFSDGMRLAKSPPNTSNFNITNNIIYNSSYREIEFATTTTTWKGDRPLLNYNLYLMGTELISINHFTWNGSQYADLAALKAGEPDLEINGTEQDPLFTDAPNGDFTPQVNSPACNLSSTGSYVGAIPCASPSAVFPTYTNFQNNASATQTGKNDTVNFSITLADNVQLSTYRFAHNQSGTLTNGTSVDISGTSFSVVEELNITLFSGENICGQFFFNDTSGNTNNTGLSCFTVATSPIVGQSLFADYTYTREVESSLPISSDAQEIVDTSEDDYILSITSINTAVKFVAALITIAVVIIIFIDFLPKRKKGSNLDY